MRHAKKGKIGFINHNINNVKTNVIVKQGRIQEFPNGGGAGGWRLKAWGLRAALTLPVGPLLSPGGGPGGDTPGS